MFFNSSIPHGVSINFFSSRPFFIILETFFTYQLDFYFSCFQVSNSFLLIYWILSMLVTIYKVKFTLFTLSIYILYVYIVYIYCTYIFYIYMYRQYIQIYICICNHENNVSSRLSPQWHCSNSCTWAQDVRLIIYVNNV